MYILETYKKLNNLIHNIDFIIHLLTIIVI